MTSTFVGMTTSDLIEAVCKDASATPREVELLDRLCSAMDEIDDLVDALTRLRGEEETDGDDAGG